MEFLLTYGWAILVVLTAISALAYFGVLDPRSWFVTNTCIAEPGLSCLDSQMYTEGTVIETSNIKVRIKNNLGWRVAYGGQAQILTQGYKVEPQETWKPTPTPLILVMQMEMKSQLPWTMS
jgi:hypothetical protein